VAFKLESGLENAMSYSPVDIRKYIHEAERGD
jgi:hypothetical protein